MFFVNVPLGLVCFLLARRLLPDTPAAGRVRPRDLDPVGVLLLGAGVLALLLPFIQAQQWSGDGKWLLVAVAVVLLGVFACWEARCGGRGTVPVLDMSLFRMHSYWLGCLLSLLYFAGFTSIFFISTLYLQAGLHCTALQAGLAITPFALGAAAAAGPGGRMVGRYGRPLVAVGLSMVVVGLGGTVFAVHLVPGSGVAWAMAAPLLLAGVGSGLVIAPNLTLTLSQVPVVGGGSAAGTLQTGQRVGSAIGIAAVGSVFFARLPSMRLEERVRQRAHRLRRLRAGRSRPGADRCGDLPAERATYPRPVRPRPVRLEGTTMSDPTGSEPDGNAAYGHKPFKRSRSHFADRITADGRDGWPVGTGRYRLVVSRACPWASRALVSRRLLGLEDALSLAVADPIQDDRSWRFTLDEGDRDPVLGIAYLSEAYEAREPGYAGGVSVPAIVDVPSGKLVTNDFQQITLDFATEWTALHRPGAPDLYPERLRDEIDEVMGGIYRDVNNGVYRAGFASGQEEYEAAYHDVFRRLDLVSERLRGQRYLVGDTLTEADIRLFTTLVRFDAVYHGHFKCNRSKLTEDPVLWAYARDLFQTPGFGDTVDFDHIKQHYYRVHTGINPTGIVPLGPDLSGWRTPHHREQLGGRPFGDGTPPE